MQTTTLRTIGPDPSRTNAIEVDSLVRTFRGGIRAIDGIDLRVGAGEIYGFLGPNGAGKSTTVHVLTTLLPATSGSVRVAGFDARAESREVRRVIGAALQEVALDAHLTGREHVRLQARLHGMTRDDGDRRGGELLRRVGLVDAADRKVATYSGGMKRRLDLALGLVHAPAVLFLDEPTTGLDPQSRTALWDEVRRLAVEDAVTVFLTTQYLEEADVLADRVGIIDRGRIVAEGTPAALKAEIGRRRVDVVPSDPADRARIEHVLARFGDPVDARPDAVSIQLAPERNELDAVVRALDAAELSIGDLSLHAPTLDDVFLAKTGRSLEGASDADAPDEGEEAA